MGDLQENGMRRIFCRYITKGGHRIYPKHGKFFSFLVKESA